MGRNGLPRILNSSFSLLLSSSNTRSSSTWADKSGLMRVYHHVSDLRDLPWSRGSIFAVNGTTLNRVACHHRYHDWLGGAFAWMTTYPLTSPCRNVNSCTQFASFQIYSDQWIHWVPWKHAQTDGVKFRRFRQLELSWQAHELHWRDVLVTLDLQLYLNTLI